MDNQKYKHKILKRLLFAFLAIGFCCCDSNQNFQAPDKKSTGDLSIFNVKSLSSVTSSNELYKKYITTPQVNGRIQNVLNGSAAELIEFNDVNTYAISVPFLNEAGSGLTAFFKKGSDKVTYVITKASSSGSQENGTNGVIKYYDINENLLFSVNLTKGFISINENLAQGGRTQGCIGPCIADIIENIADDFPVNIICMIFSPSCAAALVATCMIRCW